MNKEVISDKQGISGVIMFIFGSSLIFGIGTEAKNDLWLAGIIALLLALILVAMYARLLSNYPGKGLLDIIYIVHGRVGGAILCLIYTWYSFHLGALVVDNFGEFIRTVGLENTPIIVPEVCMMILCIWAVKEGIEVIGRWGEFALRFLLAVIITAFFLTLTDAKLVNLAPFLGNGIKPVLDGAFSAFSFPFGELIVMALISSCFKNKNSSYKILIIGVLIGGVILIILSVRNILMLGSDVLSMVYFPQYVALSLINIGNFLQRLEAIVSVTFLATGFYKISICLLAASKGVAKLSGCSDYRFLVLPLGVLMLNFSYIVYANIMETVAWLPYYPYYAVTFQVFLPAVTIITAEFKKHRLQQ